MNCFSFTFSILTLLVSFQGLATATGGHQGQHFNQTYMGYLWHLHQPLYWPSPISPQYRRMERAWETIQRQDQGRRHPDPEVLRDIFSVDDRVHVYQWRMVDSLNSIGSHPEGGAQVSYSGSLIENVDSLGQAHALGYGPHWVHNYRDYAQNRTQRGHRKLDFVNFTFHHSLAPLISEETLEMEIRLQQHLAHKTWGSSSRGYFPTEMAFTPSMIPVLKKLGIEWTVIGNNHIARATQDYPVVIGSGGDNCDIPNRADQLNSSQGLNSYVRMQIDRGISPAAPAPFAFYPHKTEYIDPSTGQSHKIDVIPADQSFSWKDGYSPWDIGLVDQVRTKGASPRPLFFLLAHDGDNAWGGGYSYYQEWVGNLGQQAHQRNIQLTTVESYLEKYPTPENDVIHVESGAWVNAESDFGSPHFINWNWPPSYRDREGRNVVDPSKGVTDKGDFWRVNIATENTVKTAQQIFQNHPRLDHVLNPVYPDTSIVESAWHFYLGALDGGFVYYGCHGDECERAIEAQTHALTVLHSPLAQRQTEDRVGPTLFPPQRHPWNPGSKNFGVQYSYRVTEFKTNNFFVWTYGYDVNGINSVKLRIRYNKSVSPAHRATQLYASSPQLGEWKEIPLQQRIVDSVLTVKPERIADYYWIEVQNPPSGYADYYIEATDRLGNTTRTPIQHVYIGH